MKNTRKKQPSKRKDYSQRQLSAPPLPSNPPDEVYSGGMYSFSETGGEGLEQQNPWQGPQTNWQQP